MGRFKRFAHLAWPGFWGATVSAAVGVAHVSLRPPAQPDLLSLACVVTMVVSAVACVIGTFGRVARELDGEPLE